MLVITKPLDCSKTCNSSSLFILHKRSSLKNMKSVLDNKRLLMELECPRSVRIHVVEDTALGSPKNNLSTEAMKALRNMGYYRENTAAH